MFYSNPTNPAQGQILNTEPEHRTSLQIAHYIGPLSRGQQGLLCSPQTIKDIAVLWHNEGLSD